ncbi:MAG TPA: response regulator [Xanthobacteraceae bacterium]|nr:response regulator [Xanthobacteraceae bacterium]
MTATTGRPPLHGLRVLIVEDEGLLALLLEDMLDDLGCTVAGTAATVAAAIDAIPKVDAGAAILDIKLGDDKSYAVAEALAAHGVPFVFATGYGDIQLEPPWQDRPVLQKPFAQKQLADLLGRIICAPPR